MHAAGDRLCDLVYDYLERWSKPQLEEQFLEVSYSIPQPLRPILSNFTKNYLSNQKGVECWEWPAAQILRHLSEELRVNDLSHKLPIGDGVLFELFRGIIVDFCLYLLDHHKEYAKVALLANGADLNARDIQVRAVALGCVAVIFAAEAHYGYAGLVFTSTGLILSALHGVGSWSKWQRLTIGTVLPVGSYPRRWGHIIGWVLQVPLYIFILISYMDIKWVTVVVFLVCWFVSGWIATAMERMIYQNVDLVSRLLLCQRAGAVIPQWWIALMPASWQAPLNRGNQRWSALRTSI